MAWTDLSNAESDDATLSGLPGSVRSTSTGVAVFPSAAKLTIGTATGEIAKYIGLDWANIPGFDHGYQPYSTPALIANNMDEPSGGDGGGGGGDGGGGSTRPSSGMIYPRGTG